MLWRWESSNVKTKARRAGEAKRVNLAKAAAEAAHDALGFSGCVTTITSPRGIVWYYTPREGSRSGMIWRRY
jgi:hypothetical protein